MLGCFYLALFEDRYNNSVAKTVISQAAYNGNVPPYVLNSIMNNQPFTVSIAGQNLSD
jgi:hypothetical protein